MSRTRVDEATHLAKDALKCGQAATAAMDTIDQATIGKGVWDVLYQQNEAIGQLGVAVLLLAAGDREET